MGGTALGLAFGGFGFAFMIFAALLGARKKVPVWRVGRAQTWMRGHLWLGLLSLPLIVFHSGFRYGHGLSAVLTTLLIVVVASGVFGAALQHYMPRVMTREVTMETIYEEIEHVRAQLREEAEELFTQATAEAPKAAAGGVGSTATSVAVREDEAAPLRNFFEQELKPFLESPAARGHALGNRHVRDVLDQREGIRAGDDRGAEHVHVGRRPGEHVSERALELGLLCRVVVLLGAARRQVLGQG